jgi:hypothetical protein
MFHLSFAIDDLDRARAFYGDVLGCSEGRKLPGRADFNFFGNHLVAHLAPEQTVGIEGRKIGTHGETPIRHFGVIVSIDQFETIAKRLQDGQCEFLVEPETIGIGRPREQRTMVVRDGCGNALEFKGMNVVENVFMD